MNKRLTLTALSLSMLFSSVAYSEILYDKSNLTVKEKIESLIVSGRAFKNKNIDKIILFQNNISYSCKANELGLYTFADIEGGNINRLSKYPLASANESLFMDSKEYTKQLDTIFHAAKSDYCLDIALAPMIDVGYSNRSYFLEEYQVQKLMGLNTNEDESSVLTDEEYEEIDYQWQDEIDATSEKMHKIGFQRINSYIESAHNAGLIVSLKHYPLSFFPDPDEIDKAIEMRERTKWREAELRQGYSEISTRALFHKSKKFNESLFPMKKELVNMLNSHDMIMLSSYQFEETGYVPYVASTLPQHDPLLKSFNGLFITDDLYQLNLEDNDISNIFLNADLFIITSEKDLNIFTEKVATLVASDDVYREELNKKYLKVKNKFPSVRTF